ncbi:MAG: ATP-binding protein [Limisphaerales bacterium]
MKFSELIPLTAALTNLPLALFVLSRDWRSTLNRVYLLWGAAITVWNLGTFFMFQVSSHGEALLWARFLQFGVIFLPVSLFHLCLLTAQISTPRFIRLLYLLHALFALSNCTGFFVADVKYVGYAYYTVGGPGFWLFTVIYLLLTLSTIVILYRKQRTLPPLHRARLRSLLWASCILFIFGNNDILPILGIYRYPLTNLPIFPFGSAAAIFYGIIVSYSVLQHHLLNIHVTLGRLAAYIVRLVFLFLLGLCLLLVLTVFAPDQFPTFAFFSALAVLLISAVVASFFFPRLFGKGDDNFERRILGDRFEYHDKINGFIKSIQRYTDTNLLLNDLHDLLAKIIQVQRYYIILLDEKARVFSLFRSHPQQPAVVFSDLRYDSPVFEFFQKGKADYLAVSVVYAPPAGPSLEEKARQQLRRFDGAFCLPFFSGEDPFGLLVLGEKTSGEPYTPHDLRLLTELVKSLSLVINQIRLKDQILLAQEMDLLGRMSRGMAHDLNNLLTPVWTYLQLSNAGVNNREVNEELLPVAIRNLEAMRSYVNEALFFSNTLSPKLKPCRLDETVRHVVDLVQPALKRKGISTLINASSSVLVDMDEILVQRLINNLLSNAIDASPPGAQIQIDLLRLARTETSRDWLRLQITDQGEGITPENLKRVFVPYFTTKDRADRRRGFGLGLAICRKIVHLHGGNLNIASEEKKGTTVRVDLPSRQISNFKPAASV